MLINLTDVIVAKDTQQGASRLLTSLLETCVDRLHTMTVVHEEQVARLDKARRGEVDIVDVAFIENAKPVGGAVYAAEKPEFVGQCLANVLALCPHIYPQRIETYIAHSYMDFALF
jgi:transformation/transcription domain-associated protein